MIAKLKAFFDANFSQASNEADSPQAKQDKAVLASFTLMMELAKIDQNIDDEELKQMASTAQKVFQLSEARVAEVMSLAQESAQDATSLHEFTSAIHAQFDDEIKYQIILGMWQVAYADGKADHYEEHLIRKVAKLIYVPHMKFMEAKHEAAQP